MALKITDEQNYQDIADAIREKLGSSDSFLPSEMADAIESIPTGPTPAEIKTKFVDYDGTVLYEYTQDEVDALTELPPLPSHTGLVCQEWNWTLSEIKALGRQVIVGANYTTDNGRTKVYILLHDYEKTIKCGFETSERYGVRVHWGDGTTYETGTSRTYDLSHTYSEAGEYVIEFEVLTGKLIIVGDNNYGTKICWSGRLTNVGTMGASLYITKIELGDNVSLDQFALRKTGAKTISIPSDLEIEGYGMFAYNSWLTCIVFPRTVDSILAQSLTCDYALIYASISGTTTSIETLAFNQCKSLKSVSFPDSLTSIGEKAFVDCKSIENIAFPAAGLTLASEAFSGATGFNDPNFLSSFHNVPEKCFYGIDIKKIILDDDTLVLANNALNSLTQVEEFIMKKIPAQMTATSIGNLKSAKSIELPDDLTMLNDRMFFGNTFIDSFVFPSSLKSIGKDCFYNCSELKEVSFPDALETIGIEAFSGCEMITELVIPENVSEIPNYLCNGIKNLRTFTCLGNIESIGTSSTFSSCYRVLIYDFSHCTQVPTYGAISVNEDTKIRVPAALFDDFKQAAGWSAHASKMVAV